MTEITTFNNNTERLASLIAQGEPINEANLATYGIGQLGNNTERLLLILGIAIQNLPTKVIPTISDFSELPVGYRGLAIVADDAATADNSNVYLVDDTFKLPLVNTNIVTTTELNSIDEKKCKTQKYFLNITKGNEAIWIYDQTDSTTPVSSTVIAPSFGGRLRQLYISESRIKNLQIQKTSILSKTELRAINTDDFPFAVTIRSFGYEDTYVYQSWDTSSPDNDYTILVTANGKRYWKADNASFINVKRFGAKGDGSNDDTTAIQNALNFARVNTYAGNIRYVYFPLGVYICSSVTFPSGCTVKFIGETNTTEIRQKPNSTDHLLKIPLTSIPEIGSISLTGQKTLQINPNNAIHFLDGSSGYYKAGHIDNVKIFNFKGDGVHGGAFKQDLHIIKSEILYNDGYGIYQPLTSADWFISHTESGFSGLDGGYFGNQVQINNCAFFRNKGSGIVMGSRQRWSVITNTMIDKNYKHGLSIVATLTDGSGNEEPCGISVSECRFDNNSQEADNTYSHISIQNANGVKISDNDFQRSPTDPEVTTKKPKFVVEVSNSTKIRFDNLNRIDAASYSQSYFTNDLSMFWGDFKFTDTLSVNISANSVGEYNINRAGVRVGDVTRVNIRNDVALIHSTAIVESDKIKLRLQNYSGATINTTLNLDYILSKC